MITRQCHGFIYCIKCLPQYYNGCYILTFGMKMKDDPLSRETLIDCKLGQRVKVRNSYFAVTGLQMMNV